MTHIIVSVERLLWFPIEIHNQSNDTAAKNLLMKGIQMSGSQFKWESVYRKVSNIRRTKFQNISDSRTVLQLSLPNLLKPCIKSRMKM